jgi:dihydrofolate reductase
MTATYTFDVFTSLDGFGGVSGGDWGGYWGKQGQELLDHRFAATVVSTTLDGPLDWPDATVVGGDAVDVVARLKQESDVPLRSHGSLSMNRALMAAGLVDRVQVTLFPVITGQTGDAPIFGGAADFDLELIEARTLDRNIQELIYRPTLHG